MANQRPIRRGRLPKFRRPQRPKRWAASSPVLSADDPMDYGLLAGVIPSEAALAPAGVPPMDALLSGEFDVENWADEQEVRVDRIVGDIGIVGMVTHSADQPPSVVVRLGIIVAEDVSDDPTADEPTRSLFDQTDLQEAEWMWLHQHVPHFEPVFGALGGVIGSRISYNHHLDLHNRRKIGQKDLLYIYASYTYMSGEESLITVWNVRLVHSLRLIMVSK